jgi:hypothetical protein
MRVWILENVPDYEQGTRRGMFASANIAWDTLFTEVDRHVFTQVDEFHVRLFTEDSDRGEKADVGVEVVYRTNDKVKLTAVYVEGTGNPTPTLADWRDLQQVSSLLMQHAVQEARFTRVSEYQDGNKPAGVWRLRREDG